MSKTFKNLSVLKKVHDDVKDQLGTNYNEIITPYFQIIQMTMKANNENEFEALKRIKENLEIFKKPDAPMFFSAALIDITEAKHFQKFKNN